MECAGFLNGLGFDTTIMARSILLRGFDQDMAEMVGTYLQNHGTKIIRPAIPTRIEKTQDGKLKVTWKNPTTGEEGSDTFDTVLQAIGKDIESENGPFYIGFLLIRTFRAWNV